MIKRLIVGTLICLVGSLYAQTDALNAKKYWKFRNSFRQDFVKIGPERGEGIPIASRLPTGCTNLISGEAQGMVRWADGMIFQGHYIGFLATEYRLLKDRGQDVEATLNELYYALNAINRADKLAEPIITGIDDNGLPIEKPESLNGFYLRDDADQFSYLNWENAKIECKCSQGSAFFSNNMNGTNSGDWKSIAETNDHSTPSLDQMTSLLVGITVIDKLIEDGVYVQPTPSDSIMDIKNMALQIANRLISYARSHNYFLLDEWGWPVGNGGGELIATAYPISVIGNNLLGNDYSLTMKRKIWRYGAAQKYYSTLDLDRKVSILDTLTMSEMNQIGRFSAINPWLDGTGLSNFETYNLSGIPASISTDFSDNLWNSFLPENIDEMILDWEDNNKYDGSAGDYDYDYLLAIAGLFIDKPLIKDYNATIMFNLGVASGIFSSDQVLAWGGATQNYQLILVDAILDETTPVTGTKTYFKSLLDSMPEYGGFKFHSEKYYVLEDSVGPKQTVWTKGWGGEYKWNDPLESHSETGHTGQFNALDYMYLHNLYYLVYGGEIEQEYTDNYDCFCGSVTWNDINDLTVVEDPGGYSQELSSMLSLDVNINPNMKKQLEILEFCSNNAFDSVVTITNDTLDQLFDSYHDIGILLNKFQTSEHTVEDNGGINIRSRLIICEDKTMTIEDGGEINLQKGEILIKPDAKLIIEGLVNVQYNTKIIVEDGGEIVIKDGGILENSGYIQLKTGAKLIYEEGATIKMQDDLAEIHFDGGDLEIGEGAVFTFEKSASQSGHLRFSMWGDHIFAGLNSEIILEGNGKSDPILVLDKNANFWCDSDSLNEVTLIEGRVLFDTSSILVIPQVFTANDVFFEGKATNNGLALFDESTIIDCEFNEVPIVAPLYYKRSGDFNMYFSEFNNNSDRPMVRIEGMGYVVNNTEFNGTASYMFDAKNTTQQSQISSSTFNGDISMVSVIDNSNAELSISKSDFNTSYAAVHKLNGKLNLKCNDFNNFYRAAAVADGNSLLDMSGSSAGGYNVFDITGTSNANNIALWGAQGFLIDRGYNYFDDASTNAIIGGEIQYRCMPGVLLMGLARSNQWNLANSAPSAADIDVGSVYDGCPSISFLTTDRGSATCPVTEGDFEGSFFSLIPSTTHGLESISTTSFYNTTLSDALDACLEMTKMFDDTKSDVTALALFEEVLTTYPTLSDTNLTTQGLVNLGAQYMKNTLGHALFTSEITRSNNQTSFDQGVQDYVNVLNALTSVPLTQTNYKQQFYWEMDKAHLFHTFGKHSMALSILYNMESCGVDSSEQAHLNYWKRQFEEENNKIGFGYRAEFIDSVWTDTTNYLIPVNKNFGDFGSMIMSLNSVYFSSCSGGSNMKLQDNAFSRNSNMIDNGDRHSIKDSTFATLNENTAFNIFPNPNSGFFNVQYYMPKNSTGYLVIHSIEGKKIHQIKCAEGSHNENVNLSTIESGTYIYSYVVDGIRVQNGKLIIYD